MDDHLDDIPPRDYSLGHAMKAMSGVVLVIWILASVTLHLVAALRTIGSDGHRSIEVYFGWPAMVMRESAALRQTVTESGSVVGQSQTPISGATSLNETSDGGVDIRWSCEMNGATECTCSILGYQIPSEFCWIMTVVAICAVITVILGIVLEWVCKTKWIADPEIRRRCRRKRCNRWCLCCNKWFCWFEVFIQWIAKTICKWQEKVLYGTFLACVVAGVVIMIAV